jgi:ribosomal protein S27AE
MLTGVALPYGLPFFVPADNKTYEKKEGGNTVKKLGNTCIECGSGVLDKVEERESRQFRFERINFTCGATLETFHTANGNVARAIHSGCTAVE